MSNEGAIPESQNRGFSLLSPSESRARCLRALVTKCEPIGKEREPEALSIVSEREPKTALVCEPERFRWRAATPIP
jgi:hypothetical protein